MREPGNAVISKGLLVHILVSAASGGCERACDHLCSYGSEVDHHIVVLGDEGVMSQVWANSGATVEHLHMLGRSRFALAKALRGRLSMLNPDAVIAWHGMAELPVILHSIPRGCRHVGVHGGNPASNLSRLTDLRYLFTEGLVFPRRCNPVYLCCSQYVADTFKRSYYLNRFQTKVVANGVYDVPDSLKHIPRIIPTNGSKVVIGMLARLDLIKDHATVIRAFAEIKREFPCAVLELAGDGDQAQNLRALTEALGLVDSVHFLGTVRQVTEVIRKWDVCVYATTHNEGFGIALAEGLMAGLPTVVTDVGPIREVCGNVEGATVIYVKPGSSKQLAEAVTRLIPDLKSRQALSLMARQHAMRHLSGRTFAKRYIQLLFPAIIFADA